MPQRRQKTIKPLVHIEGKAKQVVNSIYFFIISSSCDSVQLLFNGKYYSVANNYYSDSSFQTCKALSNNTLQIIWGFTKTTPVKISNRYRYVYILMYDESCELYLSEKPMQWERV